MVQFLKVWNNKESGYGSKDWFLDPRTPFEHIEAFRVKDVNGKPFECTKVTYPCSDKFIVVKGDPVEFMQKLKEANVAICILSDLYANNLTIKQFLEQNEHKNGVEFS